MRATTLVTAAVTAENVVIGASTGGLDQTASLRCAAGHALLLDCRDFGTTQIAWRIGDDGWRVLVHDALLDEPVVVVGSGVRRSKLLLPGRVLADLPGAEVVPDLGR